jgi:5-methylcytosine-specific restriction endonuclease McrA
VDKRNYEEKLRDPRWQRRRLEIFQRDNWTCQLCSRTDLELHVHHLYRTTEEPWAEPDLHLLTLCQLCHSRQVANPKGGFRSPQRLYKTDEEWWTAHLNEYDEKTRDDLSQENIHGRTLRELREMIVRRNEALHTLRLAWEEKQKGDKDSS